MRTSTEQRRPRVRKRARTLVRAIAAVAAVILATGIAIVALRVTRNRAARASVTHKTQAERERCMAWTEAGAVADAPPDRPNVAAPNQSLSRTMISLNGAEAGAARGSR